MSLNRDIEPGNYAVRLGANGRETQDRADKEEREGGCNVCGRWLTGYARAAGTVRSAVRHGWKSWAYPYCTANFPLGGGAIGPDLLGYGAAAERRAKRAGIRADPGQGCRRGIGGLGRNALMVGTSSFGITITGSDLSSKGASISAGNSPTVSTAAAAERHSDCEGTSAGRRLGSA